MYIQAFSVVFFWHCFLVIVLQTFVLWPGCVISTLIVWLAKFNHLQDAVHIQTIHYWLHVSKMLHFKTLYVYGGGSGGCLYMNNISLSLCIALLLFHESDLSIAPYSASFWGNHYWVCLCKHRLHYHRGNCSCHISWHYQVACCHVLFCLLALSDVSCMYLLCYHHHMGPLHIH